MFAKLLKHEFKSVAGLLGLLCLGCLSMSLVGGLILRYLVQTPSWKIGDVLEAILPLALVFMFFALIAVAVGSWIYLCIQFYKRKFTDEGYLTFTLPVSPWQIYLSSFLNFLLWTILIGLAILASLCCVFLIGFVNTEAWEYMVTEMDFTEIRLVFYELDIFRPGYSIVQFVTGILLVMNCITVGSVMAKKHKAIAAFAMYYLLTMMTSVISTVLSTVLSIAVYDMDPLRVLQTMQTVNLLIYCVLGFGGAVLSIWLMKKKLNLP